MNTETTVSDVARLTQDLKEARALVSELVKAAEPVISTLEKAQRIQGGTLDKNLTVFYGFDEVPFDEINIGDLRSLSEAVARARVLSKESTK